MVEDQLLLEGKVRTLKKRVEENSVALERIVDSIVSKYNKDLNVFIDQMKILLSRRTALSDSDIENAILKIPVFMYYASTGLESLGIEGDTAKAVKAEIYNLHYIETEGTIQDKTKAAELQTFPEHLIEVAYLRAYKKLKIQLDMAEHIFSGMKKVLSKRMLEFELNMRDMPIPKNNRGGRDRD